MVGVGIFFIPYVIFPLSFLHRPSFLSIVVALTTQFDCLVDTAAACIRNDSTASNSTKHDRHDRDNRGNTMAQHRRELNLGNSWIVDGEEDDYHPSLSQETSSTFVSSFESQGSNVTDSSATIKEEGYQSFPDPNYGRTSAQTQRMMYQRPTVDDEDVFDEAKYATTPASSSKKRKLWEEEQQIEQQFYMPSLGETAMDGSWTDPARPPRSQRTPPRKQPHEPEAYGARRRIPCAASEDVVMEDATSAQTSPRKRISTRNDGRLQHLDPYTGRLGPSAARQASQHVGDMAVGILDIVRGAVRLLKFPLQLLLAVWILIGVGIFTRNAITSSINNALSPVCRIPGANFLNLPFCPSDGQQVGSKATAEFDKLAEVQSLFEDVIDSSDSGVTLPMDMKRGESSIRDLRQVVRYSNLQSRNELVLEFDGFIETARIASYDLQRFNSRIGRAVDTVLSTTRWTTRVLEGIQEREADEGVLQQWAAVVFSPFQAAKFTESALLSQYMTHTALIEEEIQKLILEAQALLGVLGNLEDRLDVIHGISARDGMKALQTREELLAELWTFVGGNRKQLSKATRQLDLLRQVGRYRKSAWNHVSATIVKLQAIGSGLEDLRERVGSVENVAGQVPLSVHIENVKRGVERLEEKRDEQKRVEGDVRTKAIERDEGPAIAMEIDGM